MAKVVQVALSDDEYARFLAEKKKANAEGFADAQYIKSIILPDDGFDKWLAELLCRVAGLKAGTKFNIRAVMATDWVLIPKPIRLRLGRVFYNHVAAGKVKYVKETAKGNDKTQWYQKGEAENES